jgi:hypothetical protein
VVRLDREYRRYGEPNTDYPKLRPASANELGMIISFLAELYKPIRILWWAFEVTVEVLWEVGNNRKY